MRLTSLFNHNPPVTSPNTLLLLLLAWGPPEQQASLLLRQAEVKQELLYFIRAHTKIEPKYNLVSRGAEDLEIPNFDLRRLSKMKEVMDVLRECEGIKSGSEAAKHLKASIKEWDKNGRP